MKNYDKMDEESVRAVIFPLTSFSVHHEDTTLIFAVTKLFQKPHVASLTEDHNREWMSKIYDL